MTFTPTIPFSKIIENFHKIVLSPLILCFYTVIHADIWSHPRWYGYVVAKLTISNMTHLKLVKFMNNLIRKGYDSTQCLRLIYFAKNFVPWCTSKYTCACSVMWKHEQTLLFNGMDCLHVFTYNNMRPTW